MSMDLQKLMDQAAAKRNQSNDAGGSNSRPDRRLQLFMLVAALVVGCGIFAVGQYRGSRPASAADASPTPSPEASSSPASVFLVVTATPTPTVEPTVTPSVFRQDVEVEVTRIVEVAVPVEVTRIVEVVSTPVAPTPTSTLAPGAVRICVDAGVAKEIYLNGSGAAGGQCYDYSVGLGPSYWQIQVNR